MNIKKTDLKNLHSHWQLYNHKFKLYYSIVCNICYHDITRYICMYVTNTQMLYSICYIAYVL